MSKNPKPIWICLFGCFVSDAVDSNNVANHLRLEFFLSYITPLGLSISSEYAVNRYDGFDSIILAVSSSISKPLERLLRNWL
jgi:hypothetical protein